MFYFIKMFFGRGAWENISIAMNFRYITFIITITTKTIRSIHSAPKWTLCNSTNGPLESPHEWDEIWDARLRSNQIWCGGGAVVGVSLAKHSRTRCVTSGWLYCFVHVCVRSLKDWQLQGDVGYKLNRSQLRWHSQLHFLDPVFGGNKKPHCSKNRRALLKTMEKPVFSLGLVWMQPNSLSVFRQYTKRLQM